jgi:hypothetical protein
VCVCVLIFYYFCCIVYCCLRLEPHAPMFGAEFDFFASCVLVWPVLFRTLIFILPFASLLSFFTQIFFRKLGFSLPNCILKNIPFFHQFGASLPWPICLSNQMVLRKFLLIFVNLSKKTFL